MVLKHFFFLSFSKYFFPPFIFVFFFLGKTRKKKIKKEEIKKEEIKKEEIKHPKRINKTSKKN